VVTTRIRYIVYNHSGTGVRHHHFGVQNNIVNEADGTASSGDVMTAFGFPTLPYMGNQVPFAFMSVNGAADGNHLYTDPGNQNVPVGSSNVDILVVYAPVGGIGSGGGPGIWVDAFNVDTGAFSDSLQFIDVLTPPTPPDTIDGPATTFSNQDGSVSTVHAVNVRANDHVDGIPFVEWKRIIPNPTTQTNREIDLAQNESGEIWLAFYQSPPPASISIPRVVQAVSGGIFVWTGDDYCGNGGHWIFPGHGPGPAPGTFKISVSKEDLAKMSPAQRKQIETYQREYPAIAQAAVTGVANALNIVNQVGKILGSVEH
jgi:hypothetical protein